MNLKSAFPCLVVLPESIQSTSNCSGVVFGFIFGEMDFLPARGGLCSRLMSSGQLITLVVQHITQESAALNHFK